MSINLLPLAQALGVTPTPTLPDVSILTRSLAPVKKVMGRYVPVPVIDACICDSVPDCLMRITAALAGLLTPNTSNEEADPVPFEIILTRVPLSVVEV